MTCACLPEMKFVSHFLSLLCSVVSIIFCMSVCRGTVSKALLMSMAAITVREGGRDWLKPSNMCCVNMVCSVVVECLGLKPCWEVERGISGLILWSMSLSSTLEMVGRREIGL